MPQDAWVARPAARRRVWAPPDNCRLIVQQAAPPPIDVTVTEAGVAFVAIVAIQTPVVGSTSACTGFARHVDRDRIGVFPSYRRRGNAPTRPSCLLKRCQANDYLIRLG